MRATHRYTGQSGFPRQQVSMKQAVMVAALSGFLISIAGCCDDDLPDAEPRP